MSVKNETLMILLKFFISILNFLPSFSVVYLSPKSGSGLTPEVFIFQFYVPLATCLLSTSLVFARFSYNATNNDSASCFPTESFCIIRMWHSLSIYFLLNASFWFWCVANLFLCLPPFGEYKQCHCYEHLAFHYMTCGKHRSKFL